MSWKHYETQSSAELLALRQLEEIVRTIYATGETFDCPTLLKALFDVEKARGQP